MDNFLHLSDVLRQEAERYEQEGHPAAEDLDVAANSLFAMAYHQPISQEDRQYYNDLYRWAQEANIIPTTPSMKRGGVGPLTKNHLAAIYRREYIKKHQAYPATIPPLNKLIEFNEERERKLQEEEMARRRADDRRREREYKEEYHPKKQRKVRGGPSREEALDAYYAEKEESRRQRPYSEVGDLKGVTVSI